LQQIRAQVCCPEVNLSTIQDGKLNNSRRMAAGFAAGVTEALMIVTPFEVVKIRLQQQQGSNKAALLYKVHCHVLAGGSGQLDTWT
jgi:Mitochondrial carrier protein